MLVYQRVMKRVGIFRIHFASCCEVLAQHRESFQDAHYLPNFLCKKQARSPWWPWLVCKSSSLDYEKTTFFFLQFFAPTSRRLHILYIPPGKYDGMYCIFKVLGYQWGHNLSQPQICQLSFHEVHRFTNSVQEMSLFQQLQKDLRWRLGLGI